MLRRDSSLVALVTGNSFWNNFHILQRFSRTFCALAFVAVAAQSIRAQGIASFQVQTPIPLMSAAGPSGPFGLALDEAGDLFVTDYNNSRVLETPAGCQSTACQVIVPTSGLNGPTGVALDANGDVFIADYYNNRVVEVPWNGAAFGAQFTLPTTGQNLPTGLALDAAGDLYIANNDYTGATASRIIELPWNGSSYGAPIAIVNWLTSPSGLAMDGSGNLFVTDVAANEVVELPTGCASSSCQIVVSSGVSTNDPGVATDRSGDVFIAYFGGNEVLEAPLGCSSSACMIHIGDGLNEPAGVVVDGSGNIFIADYANNRVEKVSRNSLRLGAVEIGSAAVVTAEVIFNSPVTLNSAAPYSILTQGASGLDFTDAANGSCTGTSYTAGQSCTIAVNFKPARAGLVTGAVVLWDASGNAVATTYLSGIGSGPQLTFNPGTQTSIGNGLGSSSGVALDRKEDIYVADSINRTIEELLAPAYTTVVPLGGSFSFSDPVSLAVDGVGNVFVADRGSTSIDEILAPAYTTVNTLGSGFDSPSGVAVDSGGNVYVADSGNNAVKEILEVGNYSSVITLADSFSGPSGVAVDSAGNVFVADTGNSSVKEILAVDGGIPASPTINSLANGFSAPAGVSVDGANNIYVADTANDALKELTATGGYATVASLGIGFGGPSSVAVDSNGNVYLGSSGNDQVVKLDYADPPRLSFASNVGSASSPQSVTILNNGNDDLTFATPRSGYNPSISAGVTLQTSGGSTSSCPILTVSSGPAILPPGTSCTDTLTFSSNTAGTVSGTIVMSDDNLNLPGSTQTVSLTGTAVNVTLTPISLNSGQVGAPYAQTLAASGGFAPYIFAVTQGSLPAGLGLSSSGVISGTPSSAGAFSFTVTATGADTIAGSMVYLLTVAAPTVALTPAQLPVAGMNLFYSQVLTANGGTAPYSYQLTSGALPPGLTLSNTGLLSGMPTTTGTFIFTISAADSSTGAGAPFSASNSYTLKVNASTITIAPGTLPSGQVGVPYAQVMFAASGGTSPYSYKVTSGALPAGLTLSDAGLLSGMPTAGGSFTFTITATDSTNLATGLSFSITLNPAAITITPGTLPTAQVNAAFGQTLSAGGGTAPYKFVVIGLLPSGIVFDAGAATFSGTPTVGGSFPISISATDSSSGAGPYTSAVNYVLTVNPGTAVLTFASIPPQSYGNPPFTVSAKSASGWVITYSIVAGPAAVNSSTGLTTLTGAGPITIEAIQAATSSYKGAVAQLPVNIARQQSVTTVTGSLLSISPGQNITLMASVAPTVTGTPTGTVTFMDGGTQIGSPVTLTNGTATLASSNFASGANVISAVYSGDSNFRGGSSTLSSPIVVSPSFSFLAADTVTRKVTPGDTATFNFNLVPNGGKYPGMVSFSVDGLPPGASYTVSPTSVSSTAGSQSITVTIQSSSRKSASVALPRSRRHLTPFALALLLPLFGLRRLRLKSRNLSSAIVLMVLLGAGALTIVPVFGCGATVSGILGQSYSVAVTATSGTEQHTAFVNMAVK